MKKLGLLLILFLLPIKVLAISAKSAIVMDLDNEQVLYGYNVDEERLIASITKIMTAIVTIETTDINKEVVVGTEIKEAFGSAIYLEVGEKLTIKDLLYGLMLRSGNDAAVVIAKNVAGTMEGFAMLMNSYANNLGMDNTYFYNAHGLEEDDGYGNTSTARDMAILTKYAMNNETFREIFGTKEYSLKTNKKSYKWISKNKLLHQEDFITGGKTGFTEKARRTLVTTGSRNNINVVIVTLNDPNDFQDHLDLYKNIFKNYEAIKVLDKDKVKIKKDNIYQEDTLYLDEDIYIPIKSKDKQNIKVKYELYKSNNYSDGDIVGYVNVYIDKTLVRKENIYVKKAKEREDLSWWDKLLRGLKW